MTFDVKKISLLEECKIGRDEYKFMNLCSAEGQIEGSAGTGNNEERE